MCTLNDSSTLHDSNKPVLQVCLQTAAAIDIKPFRLSTRRTITNSPSIHSPNTKATMSDAPTQDSPVLMTASSVVAMVAAEPVTLHSRHADAAPPLECGAD